LSEVGELILGQGEEIGKSEAEGVSGSRENFGRGLLAAALYLGEIGHRDPSRVGYVFKGAFLGETLAPQDITNDVPPEGLSGCGG
jgi:hypothetical protein